MQIRRGAKYIWQIPEVDEQQVFEYAAMFNLSLPVIHTLLGRGLQSKDDLESYLFSSFSKDVPHPSKLKDADKAVDRIEKAIKDNERILIFGDYDVDGITSSAMMLLCLKPLTSHVNFFLPNRIRDGYGLSKKIVERAAKNGYTLIITVDNGISAYEAVEAANECGIDVIITDHHRPHEKVPAAYAVVNPCQQSCEYPFKSLAGVGVTFKLLSYLYERRGLSLPSKVYELLLLGTIADVVPLLGENRFWVRYGLQLINKYQSFPLEVLKTNVKLYKPALTATDIGFSIAPQINALGRLEDPRRGVWFLIGSDHKEVEEVGKFLGALNEERKLIERKIIAEIKNQIEAEGLDKEPGVIIVASKQWTPGVIGLVASRIVGLYGRPTILLHLGKDGIAKGSCRSIPEFNIFEGLKEAKDLLITFGGHALAAGLSLKASHIEELRRRLSERVRTLLTPEDLQPKIMVDAQLRLGDVSKKLMSDLRYMEPFGNENPAPTFYVRDLSLVQPPQVLKEEHIKCMVSAEGVVKPLIFFNRPDLIDVLMSRGAEPFDCAVTPIENHWQGRVNIELRGIDIAL